MTKRVTVPKWVQKTKARLEAVVKTAANNVATAASVPVAEGGRMRVKTGFLRNSIGAAYNTMPTGPSNSADDEQGNIADVAVVIDGWGFERDVLHVGWSANYAKYREGYDGFLETEVQNWRGHVGAAVKEARKKWR